MFDQVVAMDPQGDPEHRRVCQVLQRPHHCRVRERDLERSTILDGMTANNIKRIAIMPSTLAGIRWLDSSHCDFENIKFCFYPSFYTGGKK